MTLCVRRPAMPLLAAGLAAVFLGNPNPASGAIVLNHGDTVNLQTLLDSQDRGFIVGDKLFTVINFTSSDFFAQNITLSGYVNADPNSGRGFELTGGWSDLPGDALTAEFNFRYTVEVLAPFYDQGFRIVDNVLTINGATSDTPGAYARVDETVFDFDLPSGSNLIGQKEAYSRFTDLGREEDLQDSLDFSPRRKLDINKDLKLFAPTTGATSSISFVRQTFSQIPSPGAISLMAIGAWGVLRRRR